MKAKKQQHTTVELAEIKTSLKQHETDVGSAPVQIAALTARILHLTGHMGSNRNDKHSRRGLIGMVSKRRKLLKYIKRTDPELHGKTLASLGLRK
ncbi:MAG: 30S ribosomal protein S15 [Proteobacteria bacterium]|nr:30S ribosomal protein S15 [Pseudomonadota bacterium]MCH9758185.1 30S ribosomal protein S15 [Pseudomonadota bacterium]